MSTLEQEFAEHMDESLQPEGLGAQREAFRIDNDGAADWALRKLAVIEKRMKDADALADAEINRVTEWLKAKQAEYETDRAWFVEALEDYHRRLLAEDDRRKTVKLPAGTLKARKTPANVLIHDEKTFAEWAEKERSEFVRVKVAINRDAVKQAVLKDGEVLAGVDVVEGETRFSQEVQS